MSPLARLFAFLTLTIVVALHVGTAAAQCAADASYGNATITNPQIVANTPGVVTIVSGDLNADVDTLEVGMYSGAGVFGGGITTGSFTLTGENFASCGLCVRILTEAGDDGYLATGGTVDVLSLSPDVEVDVTNATFQHVIIDPSTFVSTPHPDGCTSAVTSATIDTGASPPVPTPVAGPFGLGALGLLLAAVGLRRVRS